MIHCWDLGFAGVSRYVPNQGFVESIFSRLYSEIVLPYAIVSGKWCHTFPIKKKLTTADSETADNLFDKTSSVYSLAYYVEVFSN